MFKSIILASVILISHTGYAGPRRDTQSPKITPNHARAFAAEDLLQAADIYGVWTGTVPYFNNGTEDGTCDVANVISKKESQVTYSQTLSGDACYYETDIVMELKGTVLSIGGVTVGTLKEKVIEFNLGDYSAKMSMTSDNKVKFEDHFIYESGSDSLKGTLDRSTITD